MLEGLEGAEVFGFDFGGAGEMAAEGGHDFNALDGVHAEVGVEAHLQVEHLDGVTGFLGDDEEEGAGGFLGARAPASG